MIYHSAQKHNNIYIMNMQQNKAKHIILIINELCIMHLQIMHVMYIYT